MEVYRATKKVSVYNLTLCESIVYIRKDGRFIIDSEGDYATLPRQEFNKKGTFSGCGYYTPDGKFIRKEYKVIERVDAPEA